MGSTDYQPHVQGLRAAAVLSVVLYHARVPGVSGGYVGVDVFFVISGYLITGLLVKERTETGKLDLPAFYARRARRLLPAAFLATIGCLVISYLVLAPFEQVRVTRSALWATLYLSNVRFAQQATDYLAGGAEEDPLLHTWSLAVEEQFYLFWPALILLAVHGATARTPPRRLFVVLAVVGAGSLIGSILLTRYNQPWAFFGTPTRAWQFGLGALASLSRKLDLRRTPRIVAAAAWASALLVVWADLSLDRTTAFPGIAAIGPSVGTAGLILTSATGSTPVLFRALSNRVSVWLGDISYSWYLWHWPLLVGANILVPPAAGAVNGVARAIAVVGSLGLAHLSYRWVENPIRHHRLLTGSARPSLILALILASVGSGIALAARQLARREMKSPGQLSYTAAEADVPALYADGCHARYQDLEPARCTFGARDSVRTIVLWGDSHAAHWFPALERIASETGSRLIATTKSACPAPTVSVFVAALRRNYWECDAWREAMLRRVEVSRPQLVVVSSSRQYVIRGPDGKLTDMRDEVWAAGVDSLVGRLARGGIPVLFIHDIPRAPQDVPECLARAAWQPPLAGTGCAFDPGADQAAARLLAVERASIARWSEAFGFDPAEVICPDGRCPGEKDGVIHYRDEHHLTAGYSRMLGPIVFDRIRGYAATRPNSPIQELVAAADGLPAARAR